MSDLAGFLLARLAEDEDAAQESLERGFGGWEWLADAGVNFEARTHIVRWHPARVLADVAAKRAVIGFAQHAGAIRDDFADPVQPDSGYAFGQWSGCSVILRHMAQPYAAHPDFDPAWGMTKPPPPTKGDGGCPLNVPGDGTRRL